MSLRGHSLRPATLPENPPPSLASKREEATTTRRHSTAARRPATTTGANAPDRGATHRMPPRAPLSLTPQPIRPDGWPAVDMPGAKPLLVPPGRGGATTAKAEARVGVGTRAAPQTRTGSKDTVMIVWYAVRGLHESTPARAVARVTARPLHDASATLTCALSDD